jgi:hypothetical protein
MISCELLGETVRLGVDDEVDVALAVERDVLAPVPGHGGEAQFGEQAAKEDAYPTGHRQTDRFISRAVDALDHALDPAYWDGVDVINSRKVFDHLAKAALEVGLATRPGNLDSELAEVVTDKIVGAARAIADAALEVAAENPASPIHLATGNWLLGLGDAAADAGLASTAIHYYGSAWLEAAQ